jgi:hypothetical protein
VKELAKKLNNAGVVPETLHPFNKLKTTIKGFQLSIPFI